MSSKAATIGKLRPNGHTYQVWTTTDHGGKNHETLLKHVIGSLPITDPGTYLVCTTNTAGMPIGSVFTILRFGESLEVAPGVPSSGRVNRWPPKEA